MFLSVHIAELGQRKALAAMGGKPEASTIEGCRYVDTWLTADFRKGVLPSLAITGAMMITAWDDEEPLERFLGHRSLAPFRDGWQTRMAPARSIGYLPGLPELARQERPTGDQVVAGLTIGRVRANKFVPFIRAAGAAEREAVRHPGYIAGLTMIRPPLVIGTFTLWHNAKEMRDYSLGSRPGGHKKAMAQAREQEFHHEMSFSRHVPYAAEGLWKGRNPLATLEPVAAGNREPELEYDHGTD